MPNPQELIALAERVEAMLDTARELRAAANGDCCAVEQAIYWEGRASSMLAQKETGK
jgi:hypothetical protein